MENVRLPRPSRIRIERYRDKPGARILLDDVDVSSHVTAVSWSMQAGRLPTATVTFHDVDIEAEAENESGAENIETRRAV